jgi:hypothetical protein
MPWWGPFNIPHVTVDWKAAAQEASKAVWHGSPEALVFVEGNLALDLSQAMSQRMEFAQDCLHSRVVYSVHDYAWYERWFRITMAIDTAGELSFRERLKWLWKLAFDSNIGGAGMDEFRQQRDYNWGFLEKRHIAPVWVGEFGTQKTSDWWNNAVDYIRELDLSFCYWSVQGYKYPPHMEKKERDTYGLTTADLRQVRAPWKLFSLTELLARAGVQDTIVEQPPQCVFKPAENSLQRSPPTQGVMPLQYFLICVLVFVCCCSVGLGFCCKLLIGFLCMTSKYDEPYYDSDDSLTMQEGDSELDDACCDGRSLRQLINHVGDRR